MKIKVTVEVEAPEGATHYDGELLDELTWWRTVQRWDGTYWQYWRATTRQWMFHGINRPHWITAIHEVK